MEESFYFDFLGMPIKQFLIKYDYPPIETIEVTSRGFTMLRYQMQKLSKRDQRCKKQLIKLLKEGQLEEIEEKENRLTLVIRVIHRQEIYFVYLSSKPYAWMFEAVDYIGEAQPASYHWMIRPILLLVLFGLGTVLHLQFDLGALLISMAEGIKKALG